LTERRIRMSTITAPLARDADGNAIELPDKAAFWEVMRPTGGRPSKVVVGRDKEQLYIAIADDEDALLVNGCSGAILLRAVDAQKKSVGAPLVCIDLGSPTTAIVPADHAPADLARTAV
jgi:hypothetical protein